VKVLRVIPSVDLKMGGPINGLIFSSKNLVEMGCDIEILSLDSPSDKFVIDFPYKVTCFGDARFNYGFSFKTNEWLKVNIRKYDAVIIHGLWQYHSYSTAMSCINNDIPYVVFSHGMLDPWFNKGDFFKKIKKIVYWKLFENKVIKFSNKVLFTSEIEMSVSSLSFKPYSSNGMVVPYGSPAPKVSESNLRCFVEKYPLVSKKKYIIFMSRIHPKKGVDLLLKAFALNDKIKAEYNLVIAGPNDSQYAKDLIRDYEYLSDDGLLCWPGMLQGDMKWSALYNSDVFVLPSHQENFGIVVSEALSTGTPVLITDKVNIYKDIFDSGSGLVANDDEVGISNLLDNWASLEKTEKDDMRANALTCYQKYYSIEASSQAILKILQEL
jgi:glycosyltransferase involved in cell wall biosynthesis